MTGAGPALRRWAGEGYRLVVVSNQSGVARGYFRESDLGAVAQCLARLMQREGVTLHGFYYCPHFPDGAIARYAVDCDCRKPRPGMILRACAELDLDCANSWLVGDILDDVEAGNRAGCRTVLIDRGSETEWRVTPERQPLYTAADIDDAARYIAAREILV